MAEDRTLADRIAALAEEKPRQIGVARVLDIRRGVIEALLDEVDSTVLGAHLTFETERAALTLAAAGRRVVMLMSASEADALPDDLRGVALSMDADDHAPRVAEILSGFADGAKSLQVTSEPDAGVQLGDSLSVTALAAALGLEADDPDAGPVDRFLRRIGDHVKALLRTNKGAVVATKGAIAQVQSLKVALTTQIKPFRDARARNCPSHADPSLTLCNDTVAPGIGLALGIVGDEVVLVAYDTRGVADLQTAWLRAI